MTPSELLILIQGDPTALALATAGNDEACASRCREIAPKEIRETLLTELSILKHIPDPENAETILQTVEGVAVVSPTVQRILKWLQPGAPGVDFGDARIRAAMTAPVEAGGVGLSEKQAAPLLALAEHEPNITAADVGTAMISERTQ